MADEELAFSLLVRDRNASRTLKGVGDAATKTGKDFDKAAGAAGKLGEDFDRATGGAGKLQAQIDEASLRLRELGEEFDRTGDRPLLKDIAKERRTLAGLTKLRGEMDGFAGATARLADNADRANRNLLKLGAPGNAPDGMRGLPFGLSGRDLALGGALGAGASVLGPSGAVAGLLGAGGLGIGVGVAGAARNPGVQSAFAQMAADAGRALERVSAPFVAPLTRVAGEWGDVLDRMAADAEPTFRRLGELVEPLGRGMGGFLEKALPGLLSAMESSAPLFETLAEHMPKLGEAVSEFFQTFEDDPLAVEGAQRFLDIMLQLIEEVLPIFGMALAGMAGNFAVFMNAMDETGAFVKEKFLQMAADALTWAEDMIRFAQAGVGWVPGLKDKLAEAAGAVAGYRHAVNAELDKINWSKAAGFNIGAKGTAGGIGGGFFKGFAHGGSPPVGAPFWVGEKGPELMMLGAPATVVPNQVARALGQSRAASVVPNERMGGGGMGPVTFDFSGLRGGDELLAQWFHRNLSAGKIQLKAGGSRVVVG